jgi:1-deoxy-D-xylulose-5-phosphate reductoisomerase
MEFDFSHSDLSASPEKQGFKRIGLFGSTGSIGKQTLDVIRANPDKFSASILTAHSNHELLISQALEFNPRVVVITDATHYQIIKQALDPKGIIVMAGVKSLEEAASMDIYDMMLASIVGFAGLKPTLNIFA